MLSYNLLQSAMGAGCDWASMHAGLPSLRNGPASLMQVCMTSVMGMEEEPTLAVPGLGFPRREAWQKLPVLEINLGDAPTAGVLLSLTNFMPLLCTMLQEGRNTMTFTQGVHNGRHYLQSVSRIWSCHTVRM